MSHVKQAQAYTHWPTGCPNRPRMKDPSLHEPSKKVLQMKTWAYQASLLSSSPQKGKSTTSLYPSSKPMLLFVNSGGNWVLLQESIGISSMHMQVLKNNKVIMFDRTDFVQPLSPRRQVPLQRRVRQTQRLHRPLRPLRHRFQLLPSSQSRCLTHNTS